jgi:hypothetical protein
VHEVLGTPPSPAVESPTGIPVLEATAAAATRALISAGARIADLAVEATELDERAVALVLAEAELERVRAGLTDFAASTARAAVEVERRRRELDAERDQVRTLAETLARREELLDEAQRALDERATRMHWRWLVRAWQWRPPRPHDSARVCALFFVPSPDGYKLLEHEGLAVAPLARISGLLDERRRYIVTKIAPWPLDERWCAYLQEDHTAGGETEDDGDP